MCFTGGAMETWHGDSTHKWCYILLSLFSNHHRLISNTRTSALKRSESQRRKLWFQWTRCFLIRLHDLVIPSSLISQSSCCCTLLIVKSFKRHLRPLTGEAQSCYAKHSCTLTGAICVLWKLLRHPRICFKGSELDQSYGIFKTQWSKKGGCYLKVHSEASGKLGFCPSLWNTYQFSSVKVK